MRGGGIASVLCGVFVVVLVLFCFVLRRCYSVVHDALELIAILLP